MIYVKEHDWNQPGRIQRTVKRWHFISSILAVILVFTLSLCSLTFTGCKEKEAEGEEDTQVGAQIDNDTQDHVQDNSDESNGISTDQTIVHIASLKGPTSIGMVKMMDLGDVQYDFQIYGTADEIVPLLMSGKADIACIPANLAAVLYVKTAGQIKVLDINTLGVLYLVGTDQSIHNFASAKGRTIYMTGKGTTPEYTLNYLLRANGLSDSDYQIEYKTEATEVVAAIAGDPDALGILPQPYATVAQTKIEGLSLLLDFSEEWDKVSSDSSLVTGVTVVRSEFLTEHKQLIDKFMVDQESSILYVNRHPEEMAASVEKYNIVNEAIAKKAIGACNLTYMDGTTMKEKLSGYLSTLYEQNQASVGGSLPDDSFYYIYP